MLTKRGSPDLYLFHAEYGHRWADVKNPQRYAYTKAQCREWPLWDGGLGVWVLMDVSEEEYAKLFGPPNYRDYWRPSYDQYIQPVESIIDSLRTSS